MVKIYVRKIRDGEMNLKDVPPLWRKEVEQALNESEEK